MNTIWVNQVVAFDVLLSCCFDHIRVKYLSPWSLTGKSSGTSTKYHAESSFPTEFVALICIHKKIVGGSRARSWVVSKARGHE